MKSEAVKNMFWRFAETVGAQAVSFIVSMVLARLLVPEDYGVIAIIIIFINIANVFAESGLGTALIQKKEIDNKDYSTIFYFNIFFSVSIYLVLYFLAPFIADFYDNTFIVSLIRVLGIRIIISSINSVQKAYVSKTLQFKRFFFSTIIGTILSAFIGIFLAFNGAGAWALVAQYLSNIVVDTIILWFTVKWRPQKYFSFKRLKDLFSYGSKILLTSLINEIFIQSKSLAIGKVYTATDLAYVNKGQQIPSVIATGINTTVNSVMFPMMSNSQDSISAVKSMLKKTISHLSFLIIFLMLLFVVIAPGLVPLLLTEKWNNCIIYLQIGAINNIFSILNSTYAEAFKAIGCVNLFMKVSLLQKVLNIITLLIFIVRGPVFILVSEVIISIFIFFLFIYAASYKLKYKYYEQIEDTFKILIISLISYFVVRNIKYIISNYFIIIILQCLTYSIFIIIFSYLFRYNFIINNIKKIVLQIKRIISHH